MDPNATVVEWLNADYSQSIALDYSDWTRAGGFLARVAIAPHTNTWMRGDRYGEVLELSRVYATVRLEHSGRVVQLRRDAVSGTV